MLRHKIVTFMFMLMSILGPTVALGPSPAYAACGGSNTPKGQVLRGVGQAGSNCSSGDITRVLRAVVNIISIIVGVAAIIMVVWSGFKYVTSNGDANRIGSAKNTLIYALVGLAIAALAQFLVHFVLNQADGGRR